MRGFSLKEAYIYIERTHKSTKMMSTLHYLPFPHCFQLYKMSTICDKLTIPKYKLAEWLASLKSNYVATSLIPDTINFDIFIS